MHLQVVIGRIEAGRRKLEQQSSTKDSAKLLMLLPRAAEEYRKQITLGLSGDPTRVQSARQILRDLLGNITLSPGEGGSLWG